MNKLRIIFFGTDEFSAPIFRELLQMDLESLIDLVAVVTKPNSSSHGRTIEPEIARIANEFNHEFSRKIAVFQSIKLTEINDKLASLKPDAGVLVSFGKIIPQSTLDIFAKKYLAETRSTLGAGIINFHPSLLPKLRGPSPIETAILNGDQETGLTLMRLVREMDAGPILYQEKISLNGRENAPELREKFAQRGAKIFREKLLELLQNHPETKPQDESEATFSQIINKSDAILDTAAMTADEADRRVRAFKQWPKARLNFAKTSARFFAKFPDQNIIITEASALAMAPGDGWPDVISFAPERPGETPTALKISRIISPKSGRYISMDEFLRGLK